MHGWVVHGWDIRPDRLIFDAEFDEVAPHRHPILQITVATRGELTIGDGAGRETTCRAVVVPVGARHVARSTPGTRVISVHFFLGSPRAREISAALKLGDDPTSWAAAAAGLADLVSAQPGPLADIADTIVEYLCATGEQDRDATHPQLRDALQLLAARMPGKVRLSELAAAVFLSPGRLGKLFSAQAGGTFPAIVRWGRLLYWAYEVREGRSLTEGAHAAGFTDLAHANRVCHEMTGVGPSVLLDAAAELLRSEQALPDPRVLIPQGH